MTRLRPFVPSIFVLLGLGTLPLAAQQPLVVEGRSAVTQADGRCHDNVHRYVDCGNGTVTDTVTGLVWLRQASCDDVPVLGGTNFGSWPTALQAAAALEDGLCGLSDGSEPGDWRLPTEQEWTNTLARANALGCTGDDAPTWTNNGGNLCVSDGITSFLGIAPVSYWSSTVDQTLTNFACVGNLTTGSTSGNVAKFANAGFWAVRGKTELGL